ncbi:unnamed protein product [Nezara viridula]|uniref:Uncharacterized protein n=1 Tax=Nezara viridula TaxID=85310 RepID=A0A9P0HP10_NEZVI|nr:unnamed protein product [Nezara viridula]
MEDRTRCLEEDKSDPSGSIPPRTASLQVLSGPFLDGVRIYLPDPLSCAEDINRLLEDSAVQCLALGGVLHGHLNYKDSSVRMKSLRLQDIQRGQA